MDRRALLGAAGARMDLTPIKAEFAPDSQTGAACALVKLGARGGEVSAMTVRGKLTRRARGLTRAAFVGVTLLTLTALVRAALPLDAPGPTGAWLVEQGLTPRFVEIAGLRVRYVRRGSGPLVLLLHTLATSIYTWREVMPALSADHDVVALDFPGFGASDQPPDLRAEIYPTVLAGFVAHLGARRVSVVGNGLGGTMAVILAAFRPDRVERLVLLNPTGYQMKLDEQPLALRVGATRRAMAWAERFNLRRPLVRLGLRQVFFDRDRLTDAQLEEYLAPLTRPGAMGSIQSLLATYPFSGAQFDALARRVRAPTLLVWGLDDAWMPRSHIARYAASIPDARAVLLEDCGHMPQEEQPRAVLAALHEFLDGDAADSRVGSATASRASLGHDRSAALDLN